MGITNDNPVCFAIRHKPGPMYVLTVYSLSLANPVEPAIRTAIPYHISGVDRIDQNGSDGGIGPLAAVDIRPFWAARRSNALLVECISQRFIALALLCIHFEDAMDYFYPFWVAGC